MPCLLGHFKQFTTYNHFDNLQQFWRRYFFTTAQLYCVVAIYICSCTNSAATTMEDFKNTLKDFEIHNPFPLFYKYGYTPEMVKKEIISTFDDFFTNSENLSKYAIDGLATTWISYLASLKDNGFKIHLTKINALVKRAFNADAKLASDIYVDWSSTLNEAMNKYWSIKNLEHSTESLCLEDMASESFKMIGQIVETLIKPFIKFHYHLYLIAEGEISDKETIEKMDFGVVIQNIAKIDKDLVIAPFKISLNQWRNIAYHHNYFLEGNKIKCTYGKPHNRKQITITRRQLISIFRAVYAFYKVLKISESFLLYDNLHTIQQNNSGKLSETPQMRYQAQLIGLYTSISSQGFLVKELVTGKRKTTITVVDLTDDDHFKRALHASQFLQIIGKQYKSKITEVIYKTNDESEYLICSCSDTILNRFSVGDIGNIELLDSINFNFIGNRDLNKKKFSGSKRSLDSRKRDPFSVHLLSAIPTKEKYFSQMAEEITAKQFIKDFSLATFSNFLVFLELGYSSANIKVNIGEQGSMIILDDVKRLILQVPALIKEKLIQQLIMLCLNDIVMLFEKNQLIDSIVEGAKKRSSFRLNIELIRQHT